MMFLKLLLSTLLIGLLSQTAQAKLYFDGHHISVKIVRNNIVDSQQVSLEFENSQSIDRVEIGHFESVTVTDIDIPRKSREKLSDYPPLIMKIEVGDMKFSCLGSFNRETGLVDFSTDHGKWKWVGCKATKGDHLGFQSVQLIFHDNHQISIYPPAFEPDWESSVEI